MSYRTQLLKFGSCSCQASVTRGALHGVMPKWAQAATHTFQHRARPRCARRCLARCFLPVAQHARQRCGVAHIQKPALPGTNLWRDGAIPRLPPVKLLRWGFWVEDCWALMTPEHFANMMLLSQPLLSHNKVDKLSMLLRRKEKPRILFIPNYVLHQRL